METPQRLGKKAFVLFLLSNSAPALAFLFLVIISVVGRGYLGETISGYLGYLTIGAAILFALALVLAVAISWLVYVNFTFSLGDSAFKISHGIFNKEETAVPYRHIQSIDIRQDLIGQIIGYSRLVVLTAGHDEKDILGEAEIEFPPLDSALA